MRVQIRNILCTTDFSDFSNQALPYGMALSKEFGAKLFVCHVIDLTSATMYGEAFFDFEAQRKRIEKYALEEMERIIVDSKAEWELVVTVGHVADEIVRVVQEKQVDLVISASHGRSGLKRLLLGSVAGRLMRTLPCPLMITHSREHGKESLPGGEIKFQRILVGCDFSPDSNMALKYALSLAQEFQSELHLAHVIEPPVYRDLSKSAQESVEKTRTTMRHELPNRLKEMVPEDAQNWCSPKTVLLAGLPNEELAKYALVQDMDLIVLGVHGHGMLETLLVGSTTDRIVPQASCPVLSVRSLEQDGI